MTEDAIAVFLTSPPYAIAHDDNVVGIEVTTSAYPDFRGVGVTG